MCSFLTERTNQFRASHITLSIGYLWRTKDIGKFIFWGSTCFIVWRPQCTNIFSFRSTILCCQVFCVLTESAHCSLTTYFICFLTILALARQHLPGGMEAGYTFIFVIMAVSKFRGCILRRLNLKTDCVIALRQGCPILKAPSNAAEKCSHCCPANKGSSRWISHGPSYPKILSNHVFEHSAAIALWKMRSLNWDTAYMCTLVMVPCGLFDYQKCHGGVFLLHEVVPV